MLTGSELRERRQQLGISQQVLARRARVSRPTITYFEQGKHRPHPRNLEDITNSLVAFESEHQQAQKIA